MDPVMTAAIAVAVGQGLRMVGKGLLEQAVPELLVEPARQMLEQLVRRTYEQIEGDRALREVVQAALQQVGMPEEEDLARRYALHHGFDRLQAPNDPILQQEIARAALLMTEPDPKLIPGSLLSRLRWPTRRRELLAEFLAALRQQLAGHEEWGRLVAYADQEAVRKYLRSLKTDMARTANATELSAAYLRALVEDRGLDPDKSDAQAMEDYLRHVREMHNRISFLFIKPAGRPGQVSTEAELEAVFVPLQVEDP